MFLIQVFLISPITYFLFVLILVYSIILHEIAHGWIAQRLGDSTAKELGRLTLNPLSHLDAIGTLIMLTIGFGWAKPIPFNLENVKNKKSGLISISAAGIAVNIGIAFIALFIHHFIFPDSTGMTKQVLLFTSKINIMLAAFNLIPIPPLDGSKILMGMTGDTVNNIIQKIEPYGLILIIGLLWFDVLNPLMNIIEKILVLAFKFVSGALLTIKT